MLGNWKKLWNMQVTIIPIVIGAFGTVTKGLLKGLEDLKVSGRVETIQTTALLRTARILIRVLETWGDLLSLRLQWKNICWIDFDATNNRRRKEDFFNQIYLLLTLLQGLEKGYSRFACESVLETEHNWNILTPNLCPSRCVFLVLLMLNRSPGVHSAGCWLSLLHLISIFSGPQFIRSPSPFGLVWLSLPHPSPLELELNWLWNSTELYNRSTPTRSLKSNV